MGATDNFFASKREWSRLKDEILATYLRPYLMKITMTRRPVLVIDCFAGKGRFDDGEPGSPQLICEAMETSRAARPASDIRGLFIEKKYHRELEDNLSEFEGCEILPGSFEEHLNNIGPAIPRGTNVLLFVDPYGIKSLDMSRFRRLLELPLGSLEVIINFTSFGFLREGCRLLTIEGFDCDEDSDVYEDDPGSPNTIERMNAIADGHYWQDILREYHRGGIDMMRAEQLFVHEYLGRLRALFAHVVDIPVKFKKDHLPKYRLIFGTQCPDGLILMADKMSRAWSEFSKRDRSGQGVLFDEIDYPDMVALGGYSPEDDILEMSDSRQELKALIVQLFTKYGITFSESQLKQGIKSLARDGLVRIERYPPITPKTGQKATSMNYNDYDIWVERVKNG